MRGLNREEKERKVNSTVQKWKADVFCFQETKVEGDIVEIVKQLWPNRGVSFGCLEAKWHERGYNINVG